MYKSLIEHNPAIGQYGDCHRVCYAYILGVDPKQVPHFFWDGDKGDRDEQEARQVRFLREIGLVKGTIPYLGHLKPSDILGMALNFMPDVPMIFSGASLLGSDHSVVILGGRIVCDPSGNGIVGGCSDGYYYLTFFSPTRREEGMRQ